MGIFSKLFGKNETENEREERLFNEERQNNSSPAMNDQFDSDSSVLFIDDIFTIKGRGTVVTGVVSEGSFSVGDTVNIESSQGILEAKITGIEKFRSHEKTATKGDNIGMLLNNISREQVQKGNIIRK